MMANRAGYTSLQACTRSTVKLRFLAGMATAIARANGRDKTPRYPGRDRRADRAGDHRRGHPHGGDGRILRRVEAFAQGKLTSKATASARPGDRQPRQRRHQLLLPYANTKAVDVLRMAAGSGVLAMTEADYAHPDVGPLMDNGWSGRGSTPGAVSS